ncbi:MAG: dockerin type I domain-containing protein [Candidatus Poribacteria bacterium]|nr:dockerin type I domain-containing protein [Candidatus Poribacteria bacterium]
MDVSCNWQGSTIELVLIDPDGTQITPRDAAANPRITYKPAPTYAIYTLENPKVGEWQIQATGTDIPPQGEPFNLTVSAASDFFTNLLSFDSSYTVGETIQIGIEVQEKTGDTFAAVLGATTAAKVIRPDGRVDTLNLHDDGSHDDRAANDGVYANNYRSVDKHGTYLIQVSAENGFSREIQRQVVVGRIDNVFIDGSSLTPAAGATLKQTPSVISAVISGPAGKINSNSIVLKVDRNTVSHTYDSINQLVSYRAGGLSSGEHNVQLSVRDTSGNAIETTWSFRTQVADALTERTTLTGHTSSVYSVAFSPDGQTIASGSGDNTIRFWDVNTATEIKKLIGHTDSVYSVAFSPDGQTIASGSFDNTIRLWNVTTGAEIKKLIGHTDWVWDVAFSPDGQTIVSTSVDKTVRLWDVATGTHETLTRHTDAVSSVSFSPDGQTIAGGSLDNIIYLWDVNTGMQRKTLIGHTGVVWDVSFSPDGQTLASGSADRTLHLWDVTTSIQHQILTGHTQGVYSVAFSPDGQTLASGSAGRIICLWDVNTGIQRQTLTGHTDTVLSVAFSPDGQTLVSGGDDNTIRLWGAAPDVQPSALAADVNGDGVVDTQDLTLVHANLGKYGQNDADINGDGIVNAEDIVLVLAAIEAAAGAP